MHFDTVFPIHILHRHIILGYSALGKSSKGFRLFAIWVKTHLLSIIYSSQLLFQNSLYVQYLYSVYCWRPIRNVATLKINHRIQNPLRVFSVHFQISSEIEHHCSSSTGIFLNVVNLRRWILYRHQKPAISGFRLDSVMFQQNLLEYLSSFSWEFKKTSL